MGMIRKKCPHGKLKFNCAICNPKAFCEHGKKRYQCKKCKGAGFCEHGKLRSQCKQCKGSAICEHGKLRYYCKECEGGGFCEHGKERSKCKQCEGSAICEHGKLRYYCKQCEGGAICEHGKVRRQCEICHPDGYLAHKIRHAVWGAFKRQGEVKDEHTIKLLGVDSWQRFQTYWQAKLDYWNQNNPDDPITTQTAATDHIKPVSAFKDSPHGNPNHHTNLQPIPAPLNSRKKDKWQQNDEDFWKINIYENPEFICTYLPYEMSPRLANLFFGLETTAS